MTRAPALLPGVSMRVNSAAAYMGRSARDFRRLLTKPSEWERSASDHLATSFHYVGAGETRRARAWTTGDLDRAKELLRPEPFRPTTKRESSR